MSRQAIEDAWERLEERMHEEEEPAIPQELGERVIEAMDTLRVWLETTQNGRRFTARNESECDGKFEKENNE